MVIFIDESGTHKQVGHSTETIIYIEVSDLTEVEKQISILEEKLKINSFHWGEERWDIRNNSSLGIQLADCLAGLIRRYYDNPVEPGPRRWFRKLKKDKKLTMELHFETGAVEKLLNKNKPR